jgi:transposase-like protein
MASRRIWQCRTQHPKRQFSVKVGTIFEDSPLPLDKWLAVIWLVANAKNGISSYEVERAVGVTQKSAWFMLSRIRLAMQTGTFDKMGGTVEVDETFIGGKARNMHKGKRKVQGAGTMGKAAVMGLLERHGPDGHSTVRTKVVPNVRRSDLVPEVRSQVEAGSELHTDALKSYNSLSADYIHKVVDHAEKYVDGAVHTNGLENFWSLLKRTLTGTYVSVEPFHLFRYLDEQAFRFNNRETTDRARFLAVAASVVGKRLTYRDLTGKQPIALPAPAVA